MPRVNLEQLSPKHQAEAEAQMRQGRTLKDSLLASGFPMESNNLPRSKMEQPCHGKSDQFLESEKSKPFSSSKKSRNTKTENLNKTEQEALELLNSKHGFYDIIMFPIKIRLGLAGRRCWYTPDFCGIHTDDLGYSKFAVVEVKGGYVREDARVKYMVAARLAEIWGWRFLLLQRRKRGEWIWDWLVK